MVIAYKDKENKKVIMDIRYIEQQEDKIYWLDYANDEWIRYYKDIQWMSIHIGEGQWISVVEKEE